MWVKIISPSPVPSTLVFCGLFWGWIEGCDVWMFSHQGHFTATSEQSVLSGILANDRNVNIKQIQRKSEVVVFSFFCDKAMFVQTISDFILKKEKKICNTVYDHCSISKCGNVSCHIIRVSLPSCGTLQVFFILSPKRKKLEHRTGVILSESDFESDTPGHFLCQCLTWASKKKKYQNFNYFPCPWQKFYITGLLNFANKLKFRGHLRVGYISAIIQIIFTTPTWEC